MKIIKYLFCVCLFYVVQDVHAALEAGDADYGSGGNYQAVSKTGGVVNGKTGPGESEGDDPLSKTHMDVGTALSSAADVIYLIPNTVSAANQYMGRQFFTLTFELKPSNADSIDEEIFEYLKFIADQFTDLNIQIQNKENERISNLVKGGMDEEEAKNFVAKKVSVEDKVKAYDFLQEPLMKVLSSSHPIQLNFKAFTDTEAIWDRACNVAKWALQGDTPEAAALFELFSSLFPGHKISPSDLLVLVLGEDDRTQELKERCCKATQVLKRFRLLRSIYLAGNLGEHPETIAWRRSTEDKRIFQPFLDENRSGFFSDILKIVDYFEIDDFSKGELLWEDVKLTLSINGDYVVKTVKVWTALLDDTPWRNIAKILGKYKNIRNHPRMINAFFMAVIRSPDITDADALLIKKKLFDQEPKLPIACLNARLDKLHPDWWKNRPTPPPS